MRNSKCLLQRLSRDYGPATAHHRIMRPRIRVKLTTPLCHILQPMRVRPPLSARRVAQEENKCLGSGVVVTET